MQNLNYNVSFFVKTVVYYYLDKSDVPMTSITGVREKLFVLVSKNDTFSKLYFFLCRLYV